MRRSAEEAAQTRRALLSAALEVFAERGYAAATLAEVAARAGLTRGAVYHHFTDKAALYSATIDEHWTEAAAPIWAHLDDSSVEPTERIRRFLIAFFTTIEDQAPMRAALALSLQGGEHPELRSGLEHKRRLMAAWVDRLAALLTTADDDGSSPGLPPRSGAIAIVSAVNGAAATWLACPELFSPAEQAQALAEAVLHGVLRVRGRGDRCGRR